ncbi:MAG: RHS repeat-associated core domain-containing protein, partial [Kiloniellaceae bacterium]
HYLGSYVFDPQTSPMVTLAANDNGSVAADAVRFVGGPGGAADIAYLHNDHLGTPQAMTDAGGQLLWWRDQTPFGQTVAEGGFSASPLRFPGQYADAESGLAYNYFRDYDPALGRYIQSDPIGLGGGLNTYGYVEANPLQYVDPEGLESEHTTSQRPSSREKHEKGKKAKKRGKHGGEKGDKKRPYHGNKRPPNHKGPWPTKPPTVPAFVPLALWELWQLQCRLGIAGPAGNIACLPENTPESCDIL